MITFISKNNHIVSVRIKSLVSKTKKLVLRSDGQLTGSIQKHTAGPFSISVVI